MRIKKQHDNNLNAHQLKQHLFKKGWNEIISGVYYIPDAESPLTRIYKTISEIKSLFNNSVYSLRVLKTDGPIQNLTSLLK